MLVRRVWSQEQTCERGVNLPQTVLVGYHFASTRAEKSCGTCLERLAWFTVIFVAAYAPLFAWQGERPDDQSVACQPRSALTLDDLLDFMLYSILVHLPLRDVFRAALCMTLTVSIAELKVREKRNVDSTRALGRCGLGWRWISSDGRIGGRTAWSSSRAHRSNCTVIMVSMLLPRVWLRRKGTKYLLYFCNRDVLPDRRAEQLGDAMRSYCIHERRRRQMQ
jgi:hypothetical protein